MIKRFARYHNALSILVSFFANIGAVVGYSLLLYEAVLALEALGVAATCHFVGLTISPTRRYTFLVISSVECPSKRLACVSSISLAALGRISLN